MLATGDNRLVMAVGCRHGSDAGQAIGGHLAVGHQMAFGPFSDRLWAEATSGCDPDVYRMASLVQGDGRNDWDLVLWSPTCRAPREFSAEVGIIHLNLSPQQVAFSRSAMARRILLCNIQAVS